MGCLRGALAPLYLKGRRAGKDIKRGRGKEMERGETFLGGWVWEEGELVKVGGGAEPTPISYNGKDSELRFPTRTLSTVSDSPPRGR